MLDRFSADGSADFIVRFTEQADLSAAYAMDWNSRGEFVYNSLLETATRSQANSKSILDVQGLTYQTYIAGNDLYVAGGTLELANQLASLPEVYFIRATRTYYIDPVTVVKPLENITWAGDYLMNNTLTTVGNSINATTDWGIIDSKADQFWTAFTVQGDGIKVANIDTGVQWNHPALVNQFACPGDPGNVDCWEDPSNVCAGGLACDNNGHGTHTMGTMVADDDPGLTYIAGMAPNATWIACKGCESSSCSDTALNAALIGSWHRAVTQLTVPTSSITPGAVAEETTGTRQKYKPGLPQVSSLPSQLATAQGVAAWDHLVIIKNYLPAQVTRPPVRMPVARTFSFWTRTIYQAEYYCSVK